MLRMLIAGGTSLLLTACAFEFDPKLPPINLNLGDAKVSCSAQLDPSVGSVAPSGQPVPIIVKAKGGAAPYEVVDTAIAFGQQTVIARTYTNTQSVNRFEVDTISVKDSLGLVGQCSFVVTVAPETTTPSDLACTLSITPSPAPVNETLAFAVVAQGGQTPYSFSDLQLQSGGTVINALTPTGATQATASAKYTTTGLRSPSVKVTDGQGTQVACSTSVDITAAAAMNIVASPANSVLAGQSIALTAHISGFGGTPTVTFSTARAGVQIAQSGTQATVTSPNVQTPFDVVVTATHGTQTVVETLSLSFTAPSPTSLACSIQFPSGILLTGQDIEFKAVAQNGEPLKVTYFATQSDGNLVQSSTAGRTVRYSVPGVKTALMQAKSTSSGALCQAGAVMSATVEISAPTPPALTCTGYTSLNPSFTYEYFQAWAQLSGGQSGSTRWVDSITVRKNGVLFTLWDGSWTSATAANMAIFTSGVYEIRFSVTNHAGQTGTCSTTHIVWQ